MKTPEYELDVKVTRIGKRWHARLLQDGKPIDEMACELRQDIGWICRTMMRWHDKCGGTSMFAYRSRHRQEPRGPNGKVWYALLKS